jgi:outer membrane protein assembly factor BamD (BamD/ComL family)
MHKLKNIKELKSNEETSEWNRWKWMELVYSQYVDDEGPLARILFVKQKFMNVNPGSNDYIIY